MVCREVAKQVPCAPACNNNCGNNGCGNNCAPACGPTACGCDTATCCQKVGLFDKLKSRMGGLKGRLCHKKDDCCVSACDTGCGSAAAAGASCCH
jgi:hypothetical protein